MQLNFIIFIAIGLLSFSCTKRSTEEKLAYSLMNSFIKIEELENKFILSGLGTAMPDDIRRFNLHFIANQEVNLEEARRLYINSTQKLLKMINSNEQIRPYLHNYPFNENNIDFTITFHDHYDDRVPPPNIAFVFIIDGTIIYDTYYGKYQTTHKETYEEALKMVNEKSQK